MQPLTHRIYYPTAPDNPPSVHHPIYRLPPIMDLPDNTSTTSSSCSSRSTVSDVAESLSSVALLHPNHEQKTMTGFPPEIILQIYRHLNSASDITALNSTSRRYNSIWRINAASISAAVLSRSIDCYNSAFELFEIEERVKQIYCIILPQSAVLKRLRLAQKQAQDVVRQGRRNDRCDHTSSGILYRGVLYRNEELLSAARCASYLLRLIEDRVVYTGGTSLDELDREITPSSHHIIVAFHELMILIRLRLLEAMQARLKNMRKEKIRKMLYVATYLVRDCPDKKKIRLGISREKTRRSSMIDDMDLAFKPRCYVIVHARRAFFAIADAVGEARIPNYLLDNRSGCHGDCEDLGKIEGM